MICVGSQQKNEAVESAGNFQLSRHTKIYMQLKVTWHTKIILQYSYKIYMCQCSGKIGKLQKHGIQRGIVKTEHFAKDTV